MYSLLWPILSSLYETDQDVSAIRVLNCRYIRVMDSSFCNREVRPNKSPQGTAASPLGSLPTGDVPSQMIMLLKGRLLHTLVFSSRIEKVSGSSKPGEEAVSVEQRPAGPSAGCKCPRPAPKHRIAGSRMASGDAGKSNWRTMG